MRPVPTSLLTSCAALLILIAAGSVPAAADTHSADTHAAGEGRAGTIPEVAQAAGGFGTLLAAVEAADLADALAGEGPFTVFAPTDAAFAALPPGTLESLLEPANRDRLVQILSYHVVPGAVSATEALTSGKLETLEGSALGIRLVDGRVTVEGATVIANDVAASNGVIHVIDTVLLPAEPEPVEVDHAAAARAIISLAIERGVPLFNAGDPLACASVYEVAVVSLVERPDGIPASALEALRAGIREARDSHDATDIAWILRRAMDRASASIDMEETMREVRTGDRSTTRLFDFTEENAVESWFTVNDDVMGGISRARMVPAAYGVARFEGALSLENNGGFATIRSRAQDLDLGDATALRIRVRGDGRTYRMSALTSDRRQEFRVWQKEFRTTADEWQEITVPLDALVLNIMGRRLPSAGAIDPGSIRSISFGIADKDETPFALEIDWVEAVKGPPAI